MTILASDPCNAAAKKHLTCMRHMSYEKPPVGVPEAPGKYAIVTAVSDNMMKDFLVFYHSIRRHHGYDIYVINLELSVSSIQCINKLHAAHIVNVDRSEVEKFKSLDKHWRQWYKPFYLKSCPPIDYALWLDVDIVVLDRLDSLFAQVTKSFFVIKDYFDPIYCRNEDALYKKYPVPCNKVGQIVCNSGVLGYSPVRDALIIDTWLEFVKTVHADLNFRPHVHLFDQGALLHTIHKLDIAHTVLPFKAWNYPAKKSPYEYCLPEINNLHGNYRWPNGDSVGGDIIDCIKNDNREVIIAHFAGLPKLTHLCEVNHEYTVRRSMQKNHPYPPARIAIVGLERAGTHSMTEYLHRSCITESWIRHEHIPMLCQEAKAKHDGEEYQTDGLKNRVKLFERQDAPVIIEANHRLSFFIEDLAIVPDLKFILMIRDPVELIRSRMRNFSIWQDLIYKYPGCYQDDLYALPKSFGRGSAAQNAYRIRPDNINELEIIDAHIYEVCKTLDIALQQLKRLGESRYMIIDIYKLDKHINALHQFISPHFLNRHTMKVICKRKFGQALHNTVSTASLDWIDATVSNNRDKIIHHYNEVMIKHNKSEHMCVLT